MLCAQLNGRLFSAVAKNRALSFGDRPFSASSTPRLKAVMLNADRLDFDGRLDFSRLEPVAELTRHAASDPSRPESASVKRSAVR